MRGLFQSKCFSRLLLVIMLASTGVAQLTIAQEKSIVLATMNWAPVYAESEPNGGVFTALTREAFHRAGYRFEVQFVPWKRGIKNSKEGIYDGVMGAAMTPERAPFFTKTESIMPYVILLFSHEDETITYTNLSELKSYTVGTINGSAGEERLKAAGITIDSVKSHEQNFMKLVRKRLHLIEGDQFVMSGLMKKNPSYQGKIKPVFPPLLKTQLYNLITKAHPDHAAIVADFNRGLQEILADGTFQAIVKKYGYDKLR